jgi:N-acetylneuraminic acid mutarotase
MRGGTGVAVNEGEIYVFGGSWFLSGSGTNSVWVYNPTVDTWNTSKTPMPTERYGMDANAVDGKIYLMGGTSNEAI